jgi:hypothetical protein
VDGTARAISARNARDAITAGISTKADVMAALGKAKVISFDSGFEVWLYRYRDDTSSGDGGLAHNGAASNNAAHGPTEFVILFNPSGVVAKSRVREAPPAVARN